MQRDRVRITFVRGTVYLAAPVAGKIRAAVFVGLGELRAAPPPIPSEQDNLRRVLKADELYSDFGTAILRFTDDTAAELLKLGVDAGGSAGEAVDRLDEGLGARLLKETGMNIGARQLESILDHETPGMFLIHVVEKNRQFTYLLDPQTRILVHSFGINAGEKGIIFSYNEALFSNDIWMAFFANDDFAKGVATYADDYDLVDTQKYTMKLNLLEPQKNLGLAAKLDMVSRIDGLRAVSFSLGEGLGIVDDNRRKKQIHILGAHLEDGTPLSFFQEPWESGFTLVLPNTMSKGQNFSIAMDLQGEFMEESRIFPGTYFPRITTTWYPRHGYLARSKFDVSMLHRKKDRVVTIGELVSDAPASDGQLTEFRMDQSIGFTTFAVGPYEIHKDKAKLDNEKDLPLEFYSMPSFTAPIKEDFILAEMSNSIRYFSKLFGPYPYPLFRGVFHPYGFGQGFPTTIMIPNADVGDAFTYSFIAHETSHQWWGDVVLWRSYRDQWLSEGFAEYSGLLYTQLRKETAAERRLIQREREELKEPPLTQNGVGKGRLIDVGPLIMGHRVETKETLGSYTALT